MNEEILSAELEHLRSRSLHRRLREIAPAQGANIEVAGQRLVNFSSNDYLGLASDALLRDAAKAAIDRYGVGACASRLVSGTLPPHTELERTLARFKNTAAALSFSSGYAAALGTVPALCGKRDFIILDKLAHACLIDAARLSGATIRVFPHNHLGKLESHLQWVRRGNNDAARVLVITESVFSMDGDRAPLREIVELKERYGALLLLDEAHAIGVVGAHGRGAADELGVAAAVDIQMGTLSKAIGASGGYIAGTGTLIDLLVNKARSFIYSTAPPPALAAAATAAIGFLESEEGEKRRARLWENIRRLATKMLSRKAKPQSAILPLIVGNEAACLRLSRALMEAGYLAPPIRYPTVARGAARLRFTLSAAHSAEQIDGLSAALATLTRASG